MLCKGRGGKQDAGTGLAEIAVNQASLAERTAAPRLRSHSAAVRYGGGRNRSRARTGRWSEPAGGKTVPSIRCTPGLVRR